MKVGVLALQGDFAAHAAMLEEVGATTVEVRTPPDLVGLDALVLPGGESTTMSMMIARSRLVGPLVEWLDEGHPVLGTCAGMILLAREIEEGRDDQLALGRIDVSVRRNAYGTQIQSFETELDVAGLDEPFHAVFIRAPAVTRVGDGVDVLASVDGRPVLCRQGVVTVAAFHPELAADARLHRQFLAGVS